MNDVKSFSKKPMGMQVSYRVCTEMAKASNIWETQGRYKEDPQRVE